MSGVDTMYKKITTLAGTTPTLKHFRSLWGLEDANWDTLLPLLKRQGFDGIEASLKDMKWADDEAITFVQLLKLHMLELVCGLYTSWDDYSTNMCERKPVKEHLVRFEQQLQCALQVRSQLGENLFRRINVHSGSDDFTFAESTDYFGEALILQKKYFGSEARDIISHETHRGRILYSPWTTRELIKIFDDELRLTLDLSHWVVVCERHIGINGDAEQAWLENEILPRVNHVHARVGSCQAPQIDPSADAHHRHVAYFDRVWHSIWKSHSDAGQVATVCHEYGPEPYLILATNSRKLDYLIISEKKRHSILFLKK